MGGRGKCEGVRWGGESRGEAGIGSTESCRAGPVSNSCHWLGEGNRAVQDEAQGARNVTGRYNWQGTQWSSGYSLKSASLPSSTQGAASALYKLGGQDSRRLAHHPQSLSFLAGDRA